MLNVPAYLKPIDHAGSTAQTFETLQALHRVHLFAVPFENLDIHLGRKIVCDEARFLHKIVNQRRGGFCYELNGAFAALLRALGFQVTLPEVIPWIAKEFFRSLFSAANAGLC